MRPLVVFLMVFAAGSITLLLWPKSDPLPGAYYVDANPTKSYGIYKYEDCITHETHAKGNLQMMLDVKALPLSFQERERLDMRLGKYKTTLDSILDNLNTIDAHHYLHEEYDRYHTMLLQPQNSSVRLYYYAEILETCYAKDQALNLGSVVYQKNKKR
ncbi:MAG: hypothetical protein AAGL29_06750 [Bacteroidota bacterium]